MAKDSKRQKTASTDKKAQEPAEKHGPPLTGSQPVVHYNAELFELWVNGTLVKRLDIRAANQIAILSAFQEENWPPRIDDPLHPNGGDGKARLRSTIHCLNGHQHPPSIHFFADGSGRGIRWALLPQPTNALSKDKHPRL
jgi:hypothetical protein